MAWSLVGVGSVVQTITTTHTLTEPAGVAAGDLLVACISSRIASTTSITLPAGWTRVAERLNNNVLTTTSAAASGVMAYIIRGASAPALTFTHPATPSVAIGRIVAYRGTQTIGVSASATSQSAINITAVLLAGITNTGNANTLLVAAMLGGQEAAWSGFAAATDPTTASGATDTSSAPSSTWRERADSLSATGAQTSLAIFDAVKATQGATGNFSVTASLAAVQGIIAAAFHDVLPTTDAWNAADKTNFVTLSNSDKTATGAGSGGVRSTTTLANGSAGKYYAEFVLAGTGVVTAVGIMPTSGTLTVNTSSFGLNSVGQIIVNAALSGITLGTPVVGDVVSVAWDAGAERLWVRLNAGNWNNSPTSDPATGTEGVDASFAAATPHGLWMRASTTGPAVTIRTEAAEFTQAVPSTGFTSWMGEALVGAPSDIDVTTGAQTTQAVSQSATAAVDLKVDASQATAEAATAGTIQATEAPRVVTGAQTLSATTQTSAVAAGLAITGAQTLSAVTQTSAVKVGLAVTGAQATNSATTLANVGAPATVTGAHTLSPTSQSSGITLGPASFAVTGAQTLSPVSQVLTASLGTAFVTVTGSQTLIEATTSAAAKAIASVTGPQSTNAVTQSLIADTDLAVTASQALSPVATSAVAKVLAAVTGSQALSAPTTSATVGAAATVTTGTQTTSEAATTGAIILSIPGQVTVSGAQTLSEVTQTSAIVLGPLPALNVTGAQTLAAVTTTGTIDGGGVPVEPPIELPSGGGGSRAYRRRLRESIKKRRVFEEEREKRIAALGVVIERPPLIPAPETVTMIERVLYEPIVRPIEVEPAAQEFEDDGGEEELLLLMLAA